MQPGVDEPRVTLSLWEKLTEEKPQQAAQSAYVLTATVQELRESVIRHLEVLINTRQSEADLNPAFEESNSSVLSYGVLDFTSLVLSNPADRERLRRSVERAIKHFEPRLTRVQVTLKDWKAWQTGLSLHIVAELRVEPEREPVAFNAVLAKDLRRFAVTEGRG